MSLVASVVMAGEDSPGQAWRKGELARAKPLCDKRRQRDIPYGSKTMAQGLMAGKKGLIMGVANNRSIAWGIAKALADQGAEIAFSYQGEALKKRVEPLAAEIGVTTLVECDVSNDAAMDETFRVLKDKWGTMDFLVHAIGFSNKEELEGRYINTSAENFALTMNISVYSFTAVAKRAEAMLNPGGSLLTLTYYGAEKYVPNYNVMGVAKAALEASVRYLAHDLGPQNIRVNAISAGAIKTLAASGISGLRTMLHFQEKAAPLKRNVTQEEVGSAALYLLSDLASGVTGQVQYVDCGFNIIGMHVDDEAAATPAA
jgi:enoyl-[acyl-carrier protein] reductase I